MSAAASASASRFSAVERLLPSQVRPVVHEELLEVPGDRLVLDDDACVAIPKYAIRRPLSSMAAQVGLAGGAAYSATKASLEAMTRSWAAEFSPDVRVNAIAPGPVYTGEGRPTAPASSARRPSSSEPPSPRRSPPRSPSSSRRTLPTSPVRRSPPTADERRSKRAGVKPEDRGAVSSGRENRWILGTGWGRFRPWKPSECTALVSVKVDVESSDVVSVGIRATAKQGLTAEGDAERCVHGVECPYAQGEQRQC